MKKVYIVWLACLMTGMNLIAQPVTKPNTLNIVALNDDETKTDYTIVSYDPNGTTGFDTGLDVVKTGDSSQLFISALGNNQYLGTNTVKTISETPAIPISFYPGTDGLFTFAFFGLNMFDPTVTVSLEDTRQHLFHNVRSGDFVFYSATTDDRDRFVIHFTPAVLTTTLSATCNQPGTISVTQNGSVIWNYILYAANSTQIVAGTLSQNDPISVNVPGGIYTLLLRDDYNYQVIKTISVMKPDTLNANFNLSSETIQKGETLVLTTETYGADSHTWNFGDGNTGTGPALIHVYTTAGIYTITYTASQEGKCENTAQKTVTVTENIASGINENENSDVSIPIWSNQNEVLVDFSKTVSVKADISVFNLLGQEMMSAHHEQNSLLRLPVKNISGSYVIVKAVNNGKASFAKVWIQ